MTIHALRRQGRGIVAIAKAVGLSSGSISNALKMKPPRIDGTAEPDGATEDPGAADGGDALDIVPLLEKQLRALESLAMVARSSSDPNVGHYTTITRVLNATAALLAKVRPPEPQDPDEMPDMVAAAEEARTKLVELVDRAVADTGTALGRAREHVAGTDDVQPCPSCSGCAALLALLGAPAQEASA